MGKIRNKQISSHHIGNSYYNLIYPLKNKTMKIKTILMSMLAIAALAGCNKDPEVATINQQNGDAGVAYISVNVFTPTAMASRASGEQPGVAPAENDIRKIYAVTFDSSGNIIVYEQATPSPTVAQVLDISGSSSKPAAFCISSNAKGLLLVVNPGTQLEAVLTSATEGMSFDDLNKAITSTSKVDEIVDIALNGKGFAMINSGNALATSETDVTPNYKLSLIDISGKMQVVGEGTGQHLNADAAKQAAELDNNRVKVGIERLASKIMVAEKENGATATGASFEFTGWVIDAVNTKFYPWAKKIDTGSAVGGTPQFYTNNFYTVDPNYDNSTGITYNEIVNFAPVVTWLGDKDSTYSIENTMRDNEQRFKNATRVVIKSNYYPEDGWSGDWFRFGQTNYESFADLKTAYEVPTNENLQAACEKFFAKIKTVYNGADVDFSTKTSFADLTAAEFVFVTDNIQNGGEVVKENTACIRWYQKGLTYYWYEIRHDDAITGDNAFGKYGIVRNNWYLLTINSVSKPGTPWYPSITEPGEGDPDPGDLIDEMEGYLAVEVQVMPWVKWSHSIDL